MVACVKCAVQGYKLLNTKHSDFSEALEPSTQYSEVHNYVGESTRIWVISKHCLATSVSFSLKISNVAFKELISELLESHKPHTILTYYGHTVNFETCAM